MCRVHVRCDYVGESAAAARGAAAGADVAGAGALHLDAAGVAHGRVAVEVVDRHGPVDGQDGLPLDVNHRALGYRRTDGRPPRSGRIAAIEHARALLHRVDAQLMALVRGQVLDGEAAEDVVHDRAGELHL